MNKFAKRALAGTLTLAILAGAGAGAYYYAGQRNQKEILVIPVSSLNTEVYMMDNNLEGSVATNVYQNVNLDKDTQILDVYVQTGDHVKKGDKLVTFDMTLQEMEQNINRLTLQSYQNNLAKAQKRLYSLQNGGPIVEESESSDLNLSDIPVTDTGIDNDMARLEEGDSSQGSPMLLAASWQKSLLLAFAEDFEQEIISEDAPSGQNDGDVFSESDFAQDSGWEEEIIEPQPVETPEITLPPDEPELLEPEIPEPEISETPEPIPSIEPALTPEPTETPFPSPSPRPSQTPEPTISGSDAPDIFEDQTPELYLLLDENSKSYKGTGTEDDPYVYLCNAEEGRVIAKGTFMNLMAGYNKEGTEVIHEGGYWYRLEFYDPGSVFSFFDRQDAQGNGETDTLPDDLEGLSDDLESFDDLTEGTDQTSMSFDEQLAALCLGYYYQNGGLMTEPMRVQDEVEFTLENSIIPSQDETPDEDWGNDTLTTDTTTTISRAEAIKQQERRIASIKLDIRKLELNISKLDKKLEKQTVVSTVDGVVKSMGDPETGTYEGNAFMVIESDTGYYIRGTVSEMYLEQFKAGTIINGYSYETGVRFEAEVREVSDYPVSSSGYSMGWGSPNSNASSYEFIAYVTDQSVNLKSDQWISLSFQSSSSKSSSLNIAQAFVRTENGQSYVYKNDNGVLKKQIVKAGASKDGGYSVPVTSGITMSDMLAFPYGDDVKEGQKTKEGSLDDLYNMSAGLG
ncbi:MAG: hypothetical protein Q4E89_03515 [Eubacteriales bacterium]|nr:hypothetical protein [Eubacteriales bacterium]